MKFQDSSFNGLKVTVGTKSVTHAPTHPLTHAPKAICPINFFKVGGIMSRVMRTPTFCICETKDADQLRGNREADQRLCFPYIDSTIPVPSKCESSVAVQPDLCRTRLETRTLVFS